MGNSKEIKKDNFKLFDLTIHQNHTYSNLTIRKEIQRFNFSFCNLLGCIFQSLVSDKFYVGVCTEAEYYLDNLNDCSQNIVRRYILLPIPQEIFVNKKLNVFLAQEYLQIFIDEFIIQKRFSNHEAFIFDDFTDKYLSRTFFPDKDTFNSYLSYVFETERYFINQDIKYNVLTHNKSYRNFYIEAKDLNLETTISTYLKTSLFLDLKIGDIFPFKEPAKKIFKNFFRSKFSSYSDNDKNLLFNHIKLNFGFFENQDRHFYLFLQTEIKTSTNFSVERYILIPTTKEVSHQFCVSSHDMLSIFINNIIKTDINILIYEHNIDHPFFDFIYEISNQTKKEYLQFLLLSLSEQHKYCLKYNNDLKLIELNELPYPHTISNLTDYDIYTKFNLPFIKFVKKSLVHTTLQQENIFIHKTTGAKYYFSNLFFSYNQEQLEFSNIDSFFSRALHENVLMHNGEIIGFIQQHKLFSITPDDHSLLAFKNQLNNFMVEDMIDDYECRFNNTKYSLFYIEFLDSNSIVYKISLLVENDEQNTLKEAQLILNEFMKK